MVKKLLTLLCSSFFFAAGVTAQVTVQGTVLDAVTGEPLPAANVVLDELQRGAPADADGNYEIRNVPSGTYTIIVTYVGYNQYEQALEVGNQDVTFNISMQPSTVGLDDVVITAFGISRDEKSIGYAVQSVGSDDVTRVTEENLVGALSGKVAGVQVIGNSGANLGGSQKIRIRGSNGLSDGQPLFVVDGVPISNQSFSQATRGRDFGNLVSDLNLQDVENISVLKGAAASALYGNRASNGVIIISTKRGSSSDRPSMTVEYSNNTQIESIDILPNYQNQYAGGYNQNFLKYTPDGRALSADGSTLQSDGSAYNGEVHNALNYAADESWGPKMDGTLYRPWWSWFPGADFDGDGADDYGKLIPLESNPDNVRNFFETGVSVSNALAISGGNSIASYRVSLRNVAQSGVMPNSELDKTYLNFNGSLSHSDKFTSRVSANYTNSQTQGRPALGYSPAQGNPVQSFNQWFQRQLDMDKLKKYNQPSGYVSWNLRSPTNTRPLYWDSPYFTTNENVSLDDRNRLFGKYELNYKVLPNWDVTADISLDTYDFVTEDRIATGGLEQDWYEVAKRSRREINYGFNTQYQQDFDDVYVSTLIGGNLRTEDYSSVINSTSGGLSIPDYYNIEASTDRPNTTSYKEEVEVRSIFGTATVGYLDLIYLDGSVRTDWSSALPANDNAYTYYGLSASLVFTELDFFDNQDILSFGKLRASMAQVGDEINPYLISPTYNPAANYGSNPAQTVPNTLANPELTAAVSSDIEFGTELRFFNGDIRLDLNYYQSIRDNEILNLQVPGTSGYSAATINAGEFETTGFETQLGVTAFQNKDWFVDFNLNWATSESIVNELADGLTTRTLENAYFGVQLLAREGEEWGRAVTSGGYGGYTEHENGGNIMDATGTYQLTLNKDLGTISPDFNGGFSSSIKYKNFSLGFLIDFQKGGQFYSISKMFNAYSGLGKNTVGDNILGNPLRDPILDSSGNQVGYIALDDAAPNSGGYLVEGVDANGNELQILKDPLTHFANMFSNKEAWLYDASYVKLREVNLTYAIPSSLIESLPISRASVGVELRNALLLYSSVSGVDPSAIQNGVTGFSFWEGGGLPGTRSVGFNVNVTF